jgi:tetratricopeptide (TPR) repeat protein
MPTEKFSIRDVLKSAERAEKSGDLEQAANWYGQISFRLPNHPTAGKRLKKLHKMMTGSAQLTQNDVNQLVALLESGDMENAAAVATRLICLSPKEAVLHNFQGIALSRIFEIEKAEAAFRTAMKLRPTYSEAFGNLGSLLCDHGKFVEAESVLSKALELNPNLVEAGNSLGLTLSQLGKHQEALLYLDKTIATNPNYVNAYNSKGMVHKEMGELKDAIEAFLKGLELDENNAEILSNLGGAYIEDSQEKEAIAAVTKAINNNPSPDADILMQLAVIYSQVGERDLSIEYLRKVLDVDPYYAKAYRVFSTLIKYELGSAEIDKMKSLYDNPESDKDSQMHLGFALGKAFEDTGQPKKAFQYWLNANAIRRQQIVYSTDDDKALFAKVRAVFNKDHFDSYSGWKSLSVQPIFVVGTMRSGTTLVEQILASHTEVYGAGELSYFNDFARNRIDSNTGLFEGLESFAEEYLNFGMEKAGGLLRVTDKMPINFLWIGLIKTIFPNARIVNLVRDPRDSGLSIFKNYFVASGNGFAYNLEELAEFYVLYFKMMDYWRTIFPGVIHDISYAALVADQEGESRRLLKYCDLDWEEEVLNFQNSTRVVKTASLNQVRKKIYTSSIKGWKKFETELKPFVNILDQAGLLPD